MAQYKPYQGPSGYGNIDTPKVSGYKTIPSKAPGAMNLYRDLLEKIGGGATGGADFLSRIAQGDEDIFNQLEAPAFRNFEKFLGQAGTRFSDLGARDSSYFENAVSGAGREMSENLQSQRVGLRQQAIESLLGQSQQLLNYEPYNYQKKGGGFDLGGFLGESGPELAKMLPSILAMFA